MLHYDGNYSVQNVCAYGCAVRAHLLSHAHGARASLSGPDEIYVEVLETIIVFRKSAVLRNALLRNLRTSEC